MAGEKQSVIPIPLGFVNAFIIRGKRSILIDAGLPGQEGRILKAMEQNGIKPGDISLILITHGHHDHFGNAAALKQKTGAPLAIHKGDAEHLRTAVNPPLYPVGAKGKTMEFLSKLVKSPKVKGIDADILIEGEMDLGKYGIEGKIIPTPGHTEGSFSILLAGGEILIGDLIFGGFIRPKAPGFPYFCQDEQQLLKSIQKVLDLKPKIIYAGHGGPFTPEAVRRRFFS
jgi:glyoxylase-like metal-dependent hydrolase (beta-lactamase superfamily II)